MNRVSRAILAIFIFVSVGVATPGSVDALGTTTRYVAYGANLDSGPGTSCADPGYRSVNQSALVNALEDSADGDTIRICAGHFDYDADGFYSDLADNLTLVGAGKGETVLDGNDNYFLLAILNSDHVVIKGITFTNGYEDNLSSGAALYLYNTTASVQDSEFLHNTSGYGAGIDAVASTVTVSDSEFVDNNATNSDGDYGGAAIYNYGGVVVVSGSTFEGNYSNANGAAIMVYEGPVTVSNSLFVSNEAEQGPAIYSYADNSPVVVTGSSFIGNYNNNDDDGGAITFEHNDSDLTLLNNVFDGNTGAYYGGAAEIWDVTGTIKVIGNSFSNNVAIEGGALWIDISQGTRNIRRNVFSGNSAEYGGAISFECERGSAKGAASALTGHNRFRGNHASMARRSKDVYASDYGC